jgi:hypothetical protein
MHSCQHVCTTSSGSPRILEGIIGQNSTLCNRYSGNPQKRLRCLSQVHATGDWKVIYTSAHTTGTMIEPPIGLSFDHPRLIEDVTNFLNDHFRFAITYKISNSDVNVPVRVVPRPASAAPTCDGLPPRLHLVLSIIPLLIQMIVFQ